MFETPGRGKRVTEMWAYVMVDPEDDCEAVPAIKVADPKTGEPCVMPLIGADAARVKSMRHIAANLAATSGRSLRLVRFTNMEVISEIKPKEGIDMEQEFDRA